MHRCLPFWEKYGYADDREYCRRYIRERLRLKPKSGYALGLELRQRGVSSRIIEEVLAETEIDEASDALRWLEKKSRGHGRPKTKKRKNSCLISCCGRGIPTISSRRRFGRWRNGGESKWLFYIGEMKKVRNSIFLRPTRMGTTKSDCSGE